MTGPVRAIRGGGPQQPTAPPVRLFVGLAIVFLLIAGIRFGALRVSDWLWFKELGYERVFFTKIVAQWTLWLVIALPSLAILYGTARYALGGPHVNLPAPAGRGGAEAREQREMLLRLGRLLALPATILLAALIALGISGEWRTVALFLHRMPFGTVDPVFGRDIGWYVFTLPVIEGALDWALVVVVLALVAVALPGHASAGRITNWNWGMHVLPRAQRHLGALAAAMLLLMAARAWLVEPAHLLFAEHSPLFGASYTDLHARIPALRIITVLYVAAAGIILWAAWKGRLLRVGAAAFAGALVARWLIVGAFPTAYQRLNVQPNELTRETPQIVRHIAATRQAWGLDQVERRDLGAEQRLTMQDIRANQATLANVRLWDREPLLQTFGQLQSIRTYYDFVAVDDDRYRIGGDLRQVMLSARELNTAALPRRTFINEHLTFTHGMGLTLGPTNQVTGEGLPVLFIKDLPPVSTVDLRITRPQIYFGELANDFIIAPTRQREFDFPSGEGDEAIYSAYEGRGGISIGSFARRLLFALRFGSINIALSSDLTPESRIMFARHIMDRARLALPFLRLDHDPYLVINDAGELKWILDAYTRTSRYPYSQPLADGTTYMRNSVKIVIDAYHGSVRAYIADPADPIIQGLSRIYRGVLLPMDSMPADLRRHVRYPEDLFRAQTALYATFHMTDPETFYHREDQWQIPGTGTAESSDLFVRHIVMRLPGEGEPEFILMRPFTPRQKDNLAAWMVARNDGEHYGQLVVYRFPRQSLVFGPRQIVNRINQDTEVARQITLWDQRGSEVIRGELLVLPIEESLIYVQPLYLRAQGGRIPELKRVIVAHEGQVVMEESLDAGVARLFGGRAPAAAPATTAAREDARPGAAPAGDSVALLAEALRHYDRARAAQRADDWATYGAEMQRLGEVLRRLNAARSTP